MLRTFFVFVVLVFGGIPTGWAADEPVDARVSLEAPPVAEALKPVEAELLADTTAIIPGKPFIAGLHLRIKSSWHTYWENPGDSGLPTTLNWRLPPGWKAGPLLWPLPQKLAEEGGMITYGYENELLLLTELTPPGDLASGSTVMLEAKTSWLACEKTCVPGGANVYLSLPVNAVAQTANAELFDRYRAQLPQASQPPFQLRWEPGDTETLIQLKSVPENAQMEFYPIEPRITHPERLPNNIIRLSFAETKPTVIRGLLIMKKNGRREGWIVSNTNANAAASSAPQKVSRAGVTSALTLPSALGFGFLGGFILNLMPCVLPVIALKIFGFLKMAGESRRRVFRTNLAFVAGIFAWFLGLAAVVVVARSIGTQVTWAFQFQNPAFVFGMMLVVFVFALNLLGVFEIWLPGSGKLVTLSGREGYGGAFLHGMFATLLATPCTAPFLGSALAFAFAQSTPITFAMFASIAAGMSAPYLLLTAKPGWMRFLPKPGIWMVRLKQAMGFLMLGTVVWLLGVLASQRGAQGAIGAAWILLGTAAAAWVFGTWITPNTKPLHRLFALAAMAGLIAFGMLMAQPAKIAQSETWEPWSPERVAALQKEGRPVFIDFTADWCLNCKYNEKFVLDTPEVRSALRHWATLKGDWTRGDSQIAAELKRLGRAGVPVYVVIPTNGKPPEVLPELLTKDIVLDALKRAKFAPPAQ